MAHDVVQKPITAVPDQVPRLRGALHAGAFPLALAAGGVLVALAPGPTARLGAAVYAVTSALLFGISAAYHRAAYHQAAYHRGAYHPRPSSARVRDLLHRCDHANIYLIIAGTYTPLALLALHGDVRVAVLAVIWVGAAAGAVFRVAWMHAPRWLYTSLYLALGWVALAVLPQLARGAGLAVVLLIAAGGVLYSLGGVVYALRRPDPLPGWFGFHEVFHAFTVAAYAAQYAAVFLVVCRPPG
jgi:hemolysin III